MGNIWSNCTGRRLVFLSHTKHSPDATNFTHTLLKELSHQWIPSFIDWEMNAGANLDEIKGCVEECPVFVCVLTPEYPKRDWCMRELYWAIQKGKSIVLHL